MLTFLTFLFLTVGFSCDVLNYTVTECNLVPKCKSVYNLAEGSAYLQYALDIKTAGLNTTLICDYEPAVWIDYMLSTVCEYNEYIKDGRCVCHVGKQCVVEQSYTIAFNIFIVFLFLAVILVYVNKK